MSLRPRALSFLLGSVLVASAASLDDARKQYRKGKYADVDKTLARSLASANPSMDSLALSFDANLAAGRWRTASTRIEAILRAGGNRSVDWLWRAAQHAGRMNETVAQRERYRRFVMLAQRKDVRTDVAFKVLLDSVTDVDVFERHLVLYGAGDESWHYGLRVWDGLRTVRGGEGFLSLARTMQRAFDAPEKRNAVAWRLYDDAGKGHVPGGYRRAYGVLLEGAIHDGLVVRKFLEKLDWNYDLLLRGFEKTMVPIDRYTLDRLSHLPDTEDLDRRLEIGRRILKKEALYRGSSDPHDYAQYLDVIVDAPNVFRIEAQALLTLGSLQSRIVELAERPCEWGDALKTLWTETHDRYAENSQDRRQMVMALPRLVPMDRLDDYFGADGEFRDALVKASGNGLELKLHHIASYAKVPADKQALLDTVRKGMSRFPGTYNGQHIGQTVFACAFISSDEKVSLLKTAVSLSGGNPPFQALYAQAQKHEGLIASDAFKAFVQELDLKAPAKDPLRQAHCSIQTAKAGDAYAILESAFQNLGARFPGKKDSERNAMMRDVVERFWQLAWNDAALVGRGGALMSQHLGDDPYWWGRIVRRVREHNQAAALAQMAENYFVRIKSGWQGTPEVWNDFSRLTPEKGAARSMLTTHYAHLSPSACREHVSVLGHLSREAWLKEFEAIVNAHEVDAFSQNDILWMVDTLYEEARKHKLSLPAGVLARLWPCFVEGRYATDRTMQQRFMRLHEHGQNTPEVITRYVRAGTSPVAQFNHFSEVYEWLVRFYPVQNKALPKDKDPSHRQGLRATLFEALLAKVDPGEYSQIRFGEGLVEDILRAAREKSPGGASQSEALSRVIGGGGQMSGDGRSAWTLIVKPLKDAVRSEDWTYVYAALQQASRLPLHVNYYADIRNNAWGPIVESLEAAEAWEPLHFMCTSLMAQKKTRWGKTVPENVVSWLQTTRARTLRYIPGAYPVSERDPAFSLYVAADEWALGNEGRAWGLIEDNVSRFNSEWVKLDKGYVVWALEQLRRRQRHEDARTLAMNVLQKESYLSREHLASVRLVKADMYRDEKRFEAARIEYETIRLDEALKHTAAARTAKSRVLELMIMTGDYDGAEVVLERWRTHSQPYMRTEAHYFTGLIAFKRGSFDAAREALQKAFEITPDHTEARLLEGEIKALTGKGVGEPEIPVGARGEREYIVPGRTLSVTLTDRNLAVVKQGQAVPVIVTTTMGGDRERIDLYPGAAKPNEFRASIGTQLGSVAPGNLSLEVMGSDEVLYQVDPAFVKASGIASRPAKRLRVLDDARLSASAGRILTEEEEVEARLSQRGSRSGGNGVSKRDYGRSGESIRPGNPIYMLVRDRDRDMSDSRDTVDVRLETTSGDVVDRFPLRETKTHSGIFRAEITSALPPPRATASDAAEGQPVSAIINTTQPGHWVSHSDGVPGKWLEVDTMSSFETARVALRLPRPERVHRAVLLGSLVEGYDVLGVFPDSEHALKGGVMYQSIEVDLERLSLIRDRVALQGTHTGPFADPTFSRDNTHMKGKSGALVTRVTGKFVLTEQRKLSLKFIQKDAPKEGQCARLFIDGTFVMGGCYSAEQIDDINGTVFLGPGIHDFEMLVRDGAAKSNIILGYRTDDALYAALPAEWFSVEAHPELAAALAPHARIFRDETGLVAELASTPRLRTLRWRIDDYDGQSVAASSFEIVSAQGDTIVPAKDDFSSASRNDVVEIAAGDRVDVAYRDDVRTRNAAPVLHANLVSTYYNGKILIAHETVIAGAEGRVSSRINNAVRYKLGDRVLIVVTEHDLDTSVYADSVTVTIATSSGESLTVVALEQDTRANDDPDTPIHTGVFHALVTLGEKTGGDTLRAVAGDSVTASYLDQENTDPGIPIDRSYSMREAGHGAPELALFKTRTDRVEDGSEGAQRVLAQMAQRGEDVSGVKVYRDQMVATPLAPSDETARVSLGVPFMFEVAQPSMALHKGSVLKALVFTESEIEAARAEGREPEGVEVTMSLNSMQGVASSMGYNVAIDETGDSAEDVMEQGLFRGLVRIQVGAAPETGVDEAGGVPTLVVSGKDRLVVRIKDEASGTWVSRTAQLASQGQIALLDDSYTADRNTIHMGERFFVRVVDRDQNVSAELDSVSVQVSSRISQQEASLILKETMPYSGIFTGFIATEFPDESPAQSDTNDTEHVSVEDTGIGVAFGDELTFVYRDPDSLQGGATNISVTGQIRRGADGALTGFSKRFGDPEMAVKVRFLRAEALFEMAKEHYALKNQERSHELISEGKRILEEALRDYPDTALVSQGRFLLANLAQELARVEETPAESNKLLNEAIARYAHIISSWPEIDFAPQSQYRMAICLEKLEEYDRATEEYVKLTYTWPEHALVPEATVRLANHYYRTEQYPIAAKIFLSFYKNNKAHALAPKSLFLGGQCYIKHGLFLESDAAEGASGRNAAYGLAVAALRDLIDYFPDEKDLRAESMYWLGDTYFKLGNYRQSYIALKKLTWDYPETQWAQYGRGYLTDEKFARIEENN